MTRRGQSEEYRTMSGAECRVQDDGTVRPFCTHHSALCTLHSALTPLRLIDTHCHLNHRDFAGDRDPAIARAHEAGVEAMVVIGYALPSSERAVELADAHPELWATVGVHPHHAASLEPDVLARLGDLAAHPRVVAVGEIGLDF